VPLAEITATPSKSKTPVLLIAISPPNQQNAQQSKQATRHDRVLLRDGGRCCADAFIAQPLLLSTTNYYVLLNQQI